jgi:hypothetical protein
MTILDEFSRDPEHVLDRLVDGELSPQQCRELLAALDDEPGGWRRCGLAFLEAQTWRHELSRVAAEPILAQLSAPAPKSRTKRSAFLGGGLLAVAASLAAAFVLGTRFPTTGSLATGGPKTAQESARQIREIPPAEAVLPPSPLAQNDDPKAGPTDSVPWQTVTLTPVGGKGEPIQLRVVDEGQYAARPPATQRSGLFGQLSRSFERDGWQVDRRQGELPIDLSDGRQLVVPIEEVNLKSPPSVQF